MQTTDDTDAMTREELKAYLEANEERVRRMTKGVSQKLDKHLEVLQESNERFRAEVREDLVVARKYSKWTCWLDAVTLVILVVTACLTGLLMV